MQRISVPLLQPGMVTARRIYSDNGRLIMNAATTLTDSTITKLRNMGIGSIYIQNPLFAELEIPELVREDTRVKMILSLHSVISRFQRTQTLEIQPLKILLKQLVAEIMDNRNSMVHYLDMRVYEDYILGRSINVCILAALTAINMGYNEERLHDLTLGVLLHDIGMTQIPQEIVTKAGPLTAEELAVVQTHTKIGFEVLRKLRVISTPAAHIAFQHHERIDGLGYPRRLKGEEIHEFARITAVADVFDAMISDRPYRKGMLPHQAYETLMTMAGTQLDRDIVNIFLTNVAVYPVGTVVQLNSGEIAIVTSVFPKLQTRPGLSVLTDKTGVLLKDPKAISLTEHLTLFVYRVLKETEIFALGEVLKSS